MFNIVLILLLMNAFYTAETTQRFPQTFVPLVFSKAKNSTNKCSWLKPLKYQNRLCWEKKGLSDILLKVKHVSVSSCRKRFEYDQWNCSDNDFLFKEIYRETAFMYSLVSSALTFSVARACSERKLTMCQCGKYSKLKQESKKQFPACSDNIKFAKRFTKKFLQLRKKSLNPIIKHNSEIGIRIAAESKKKICRCHGISGTCSLRTCRIMIRPFEDVVEKLKELYHSAIAVTNQATMVEGNDRRLFYLKQSPNFCERTVGRRCQTVENCETLCCGRNFQKRVEIFTNQTCKCVFSVEIHNIVCEPCQQEKSILICN